VLHFQISYTMGWCLQCKREGMIKSVKILADLYRNRRKPFGLIEAYTKLHDPSL
jgi:NADH:ubiquinone oxidoreductase subunit F (NADH-binding)